jgi:hypothetical protein
MNDVSATLVFTQNGESVTISAPADADYTVTGSGSYKKTDLNDAYNSWGNKQRGMITYSFTLTAADGRVYKANDVLVSRDRAVTLETYTPVAL